MNDVMSKISLALLVLASACADDVVGAVVPTISVTPPQIDLGDTPIGGLKSHLIEVKSVGSAALTVTSITLRGAGDAMPSADLALALAEMLPKSIAPGSALSFSLDHIPRDLVLDAGLIRIVSDDPAALTVDVPIMQTGAGAPKIAGVPDAEAAKVEARTPGGIATFIESVPFGQVDVGMRKRVTFHLVNAGNGNTPLNVTRAALVAANAEVDVTLTPVLPVLLPPLSAQGLRPNTVVSTAVEVSWAPTRTASVLNEILRVESNDPLRPMLDIPLTGNTQQVDPPIMRIEPAAGLAFGTVQVGMTSQKTFTIFNDGASPLPIEPMVISSTAAFTFNTAPGAASIPAGGMRTFTVVYQPTAVRADAANIAIVSSAPSIMPISYPLTGDGDLHMACTPARVDPNEPANEMCSAATARGNMLLLANQESSLTVTDGQLELPMDADWQKFELEVDAGCSPFVGYDLHASVQLAAGDQGEVCIYMGDCTNPTRPPACAAAGGDARVLLLFGQAACDQFANHIPVFVRVRHTAGEPTCQPYTLTFRAR